MFFCKLLKKSIYNNCIPQTNSCLFLTPKCLKTLCQYPNTDYCTFNDKMTKTTRIEK